MIATQLPPATLAAVGALCWERGTPLIVVRATGFLGCLRLQLRNHEVNFGQPLGRSHGTLSFFFMCLYPALLVPSTMQIIESKPDTKLFDFRIKDPFTALQVSDGPSHLPDFFFADFASFHGTLIAPMPT